MTRLDADVIHPFGLDCHVRPAVAGLPRKDEDRVFGTVTTPTKGKREM